MNPIASNNNNWSRQIVVLWQERCGGLPQVGRLRALKPLVDQYGIDVVKRVLNYYLDHTNVKYVSLFSFVSKFGAFHKEAVPQIKVSASRFTPH